MWFWSEKVDRIIRTINLAICLLELSPPWFVKAAQEVMYEYIQGEVIKSVVLFACKSALSPQEVITEFNSTGQFLVSIQILLFEEGF